MIASVYIGDDPWPQPEDFEVMDSKEAASRFEAALDDTDVGDSLYIVARAVEEGP